MSSWTDLPVFEKINCKLSRKKRRWLFNECATKKCVKYEVKNSFLTSAKNSGTCAWIICCWFSSSIMAELRNASQISRLMWDRISDRDSKSWSRKFWESLRTAALGEISETFIMFKISAFLARYCDDKGINKETSEDIEAIFPRVMRLQTDVNISSVSIFDLVRIRRSVDKTAGWHCLSENSSLSSTDSSSLVINCGEKFKFSRSFSVGKISGSLLLSDFKESIIFRTRGSYWDRYISLSAQIESKHDHHFKVILLEDNGGIQWSDTSIFPGSGQK